MKHELQCCYFKNQNFWKFFANSIFPKSEWFPVSAWSSQNSDFCKTKVFNIWILRITSFNPQYGKQMFELVADLMNIHKTWVLYLTTYSCSETQGKSIPHLWPWPRFLIKVIKAGLMILYRGPWVLVKYTVGNMFWMPGRHRSRKSLRADFLSR